MDIIERLDQERGELEYRINRLSLFLHEQEKTQTVSDEQIDLLYRQRLFMQGYKNILDLRINDLEEHHD